MYGVKNSRCSFAVVLHFAFWYVDFLYLKFRQDIDMTYAVFFAIYLVFYRHEKAIAYLILLLFGLYLGNKIAIRANRHIVDQANKKNTP